MINKYELYSFTVYLYLNVFFYSYFLKYNLYNFFILSFGANLITNYLLKFNIFTLIRHKYLKENFNTIVLPQFLTCLINININTCSNYYIIIPINLINFYYLKNIFKEEYRYSFNLRYLITLSFFCSRIFFKIF